MERSAILIIAREPMIAALMGALVEHAGHQPMFPSADEEPLDAITRAGATLVLLDCEHDLADEDDAFEQASRADSGVLLFSAQRTQREAELLATRHGVPAFVLPLRPREFRLHVDSALGEVRSADSRG